LPLTGAYMGLATVGPSGRVGGALRTAWPRRLVLSSRAACAACARRRSARSNTVAVSRSRRAAVRAAGMSTTMSPLHDRDLRFETSVKAGWRPAGPAFTRGKSDGALLSQFARALITVAFEIVLEHHTLHSHPRPHRSRGSRLMRSLTGSAVNVASSVSFLSQSDQ
jgi:hypothetical protein